MWFGGDGKADEGVEDFDGGEVGERLVNVQDG